MAFLVASARQRTVIASGAERSAGRVAIKLVLAAARFRAAPCRAKSVAAPSDPERYASAQDSAIAMNDAVMLGSAMIHPLAANGSEAAAA